MSSGQQASANFGAGFNTQYTMILGTTGTGSNGFTAPGSGAIGAPYGELQPNNSFKGTTIAVLNSNDNTPGNLVFRLFGLFPQNYFTSITVQKTNGAIETFTTATASFSQPSNNTQWIWSNIPGGMWTTALSPRSISFVL